MVTRVFSRFLFPPIQNAALGAAVSFYFLFYMSSALVITVLLILLVTLCFFRVLNSVNIQPRLSQPVSLRAAALLIGVLAGICAANDGYNKVNFGIPENNVLAIEGVLLEDPRIVSGGSVMASVSLRKSTGKDVRVSSRGDITVFFPAESAAKLKEFGRGVTIYAEGTLSSSERRYLSFFQSNSNNAQDWTFSAKSLHIVHTAPVIEKTRTGIRQSLINRFEGKPWGGLSIALLLGVRENLDADFTSMYRNAGLSYILALSGMHLAILAALIAFILKKPLGLKVSAVTGSVIILLYCFLVGPMPSLNRSALMYILGVAAIIFALPKNALSILSLSFLMQIIITPAAGNSISFILSYIALFGILVVGKALYSLFAGKVPDFLLQPLSVSGGAFLATAGVCGFYFGTIAPVGIIAGLIIIPLTAIFMIGSILWLVLDIFSLSVLLDIPLSILYKLMESTASFAGNVPGISASSTVILVFSISLMLLIITLEYRRRTVLLQLKPFL
ncbi:MAG: ComEC/Rec2 family competence protein [Treponema sp.]|nr:ComEC/Rec2 family competence protein [Treponema sp.]